MQTASQQRQAFVNRITAEGLPEFFIKDIPPVSSANLKVTRPEIYFGETSNEYVFVRTKAPEFDYPVGDKNVYSQYEGRGGVPLSVTLTLITLVLGACAPEGVQAKAPLPALMVAPVGALARL